MGLHNVPAKEVDCNALYDKVASVSAGLAALAALTGESQGTMPVDGCEISALLKLLSREAFDAVELASDLI